MRGGATLPLSLVDVLKNSIGKKIITMILDDFFAATYCATTHKVLLKCFWKMREKETIFLEVTLSKSQILESQFSRKK